MGPAKALATPAPVRLFACSPVRLFACFCRHSDYSTNGGDTMTQKLPTTVLGRTKLQITRLGYGAMEVRGSRIWSGRPVTEDQAKTILNAVLDNGINFIDTSNDYGRSEEFIGRFIAHRRSEFNGAECGCAVTRRDENTDDTPHVWTADNLWRGLHESLLADEDRLCGCHSVAQPAGGRGRAERPGRCSQGDEGAKARRASSASPPRCRTCLPICSGASLIPSRYRIQRWSVSTKI